MTAGRPACPVVEAVDVTKIYPSGGSSLRVISGLSVSLAPGQILGICGPSGSGKSTLLRLLAGIEPPSSGEVLLDGSPLWRRRPGGWRRQAPRPGFVMPVHQDPTSSLDHRWPLWRSITEPLMVGSWRRWPSRGDRRRLSCRLLAEVGLAHLDPDLGPHELSVGQRQRVCILRALVAEPALVLADEPTSALDVTSAAGILHLLCSVAARGAALVVVSHDADMLAVLAGTVLCMGDGRLEAMAVDRRS